MWPGGKSSRSTLLPRKKVHEIVRQRNSALPHQRGGGNVTAILVVERDPGVCNFLIDALENELSAFVKCVDTGSLGAKAIDTGCFDLAIIDVGMSQISGYELAKRAAN